MSTQPTDPDAQLRLNQSPATPEPPPPWMPSTPLEHAAVKFVESLTKTHEELWTAIEVSKAGLRDAAIAFVQKCLEDPAINTMHVTASTTPEGGPHA